MNNSELISQHTKPTLQSLKSTQALYAIRHSEDDHEKLVASLKAVRQLCDEISQYVMKNRVSLQDEDFRIYTRPKDQQDTEYYCLSPHLNIGYSPFIFLKPEKIIRGVFVKIEQHRFTWCSTTMNKKAQKLYQDSFKNDAPISMKEAKALIETNLVGGNLDNIPLIEKVSCSTFYLDLDNQRILSKSSHRDQDGITTFFKLLAKAAQVLHEKSKAVGFDELVKDACTEPFYIDPYTNRAIAKGLAFGAYNIDKLVEFYATQGPDSKACSVSPTWSADLISKDSHVQKIQFRNSIGIFLDGISDQKQQPTFTMINRFAGSKSLDVTKIEVVGEVPVGQLLKEYNQEYVPDEGEQPADTMGDFIDLTFKTHAKDGNICIQICDPLREHSKALQWRLRKHLNENHCSSGDIERLFLTWLGLLLEVVHNSIDLFTTLYMDSNPVTKAFGEKSGVETLLEQAS